MSSMSKQKKILTVAVLSIAMIQMCFFALTPAIAKIQSEVFPFLSLSQIQTVMMAPSIISLVVSMIAALLINNNLISKKSAVVIGLSFLTLTGAISFLFHTEFWHLVMLCVFVGIGAGMFIPAIASIMFDNFDEDERRFLSGYQTSFINLGGIILSSVAGILINIVWYGGFITMLISLPVVILAAIAIPGRKKVKTSAPSSVAEPKADAPKTKMPKDVFYYSLLTGLFLFMYVVCSSNLSNHLKNAQIGNPATAGIIVAVTMGGGVFSGLFFNKLSAKFSDYLIGAAYVVLFVGFTIMNLGHASLVMNIVGAFVVGSAMSLITPQCLLSVSNIVDPSNSASATSLIVSVAPGIGGFLSPLVITNITTLLGGDSTNFRFQFVGALALVIGLLVWLNTSRRQKAKNGALSAKLAVNEE